MGPPRALALWRSYARGGIGSARLFNALKPATLATFQRKELSDKEFDGLVARLLDVESGINMEKRPNTSSRLRKFVVP